MAITPQTTPYHRYRIGKGRQLFGIPSCHSHRPVLPFDQGVGQQRYQREQPQHNRRAARNRQRVPLPLRFHSQMRTRLFKGHFHPPAPHEPRQHLQWCVFDIRRHQRLCLKLAERVTHHKPANQDRRLTALLPDGSLAMNLDLAFATAIPMVKLDLRPFCFARLKP